MRGSDKYPTRGGTESQGVERIDGRAARICGFRTNPPRQIAPSAKNHPRERRRRSDKSRNAGAFGQIDGATSAAGTGARPTRGRDSTGSGYSFGAAASDGGKTGSGGRPKAWFAVTHHAPLQP